MKISKQLTYILAISIVLNVALFILLFFITSQEGETAVQPTIDQTAVAVAVLATINSESDQATPIQQEETSSTVTNNNAQETLIPIVTSEQIFTPTLEPTEEPSPSPELTSTPQPTSTPEPTATPSPEPSPTAVVLQGPAWLQYLNQFRHQAGLPPVAENPGWSDGGRLHSTYMSKTGNISHNEDTNSPFFTKAGQIAGQNGNLATTFIGSPEYDWAFNYWASAPFHALPMLDPQLGTVGFGTFRDAGAPIQVAATLDIKQGLTSEEPGISYPVLFPKDGGEAWVLRYSLPEFPDGRPHCGFGSVAGAPIIIQIGSGDQVPNVTRSVLKDGDRNIEHCIFDETNYFNSNATMQQAGRSILDQRDGIIILPRNPLEVGKNYSVEVDVNGMTISWSFNTVKPPAQP